FVVAAVSAQQVRPPAYPLITHDPYFSIWSTTDELNASPTRHWTGQDQSIVGLIKVDGKFFRFMGDVAKSYDVIVPAADDQAYEAMYTTTAPDGDWKSINYKDA